MSGNHSVIAECTSLVVSCSEVEVVSIGEEVGSRVLVGAGFQCDPNGLPDGQEFVQDHRFVQEH